MPRDVVVDIVVVVVVIVALVVVVVVVVARVVVAGVWVVGGGVGGGEQLRRCPASVHTLATRRACRLCGAGRAHWQAVYRSCTTSPTLSRFSA